MPFMNGLFNPDTTQKADEQEGTFGESQVLIKSRRMIGLRGNRFGAKESFTYAAKQFLGFKPSLLVNIIEGLGWLLTPSVILNATLGLYALGVSGVLLGCLLGSLLLLLAAMLAYSLSLAPSLTTPVCFRLGLLTLALVLL